METDLKYLKNLMAVFLKSPKRFILISDLDNAGFDIMSDEGFYHYNLLIAYKYVISDDLSNEMVDLGYEHNVEGYFKNESAKVRLTKEGLEFAQILQEPFVYDKLKEFSQSHLNIIKEMGTDLLKAYQKNKLNL